MPVCTRLSVKHYSEKLPPEIIVLISQFVDDDTIYSMMLCSKFYFKLLDPLSGFIKHWWEGDDTDDEKEVQQDPERCHWKECGKTLLPEEKIYKSSGLSFCSRMCREYWNLS